ncbi:EamA family transporter [Cupriavidus sp. WGtm5]|uniref:EamA family transporter n=1 Tax=Cupriavidus sp. WGtm5 TaxID=2919926 RepID=UPI002091A781|nr:EamA family transporter [Cupriavidus sp. WGtm5]MCO4888759.1 EamA family transporter [Cupriavidus sp. WGtm5]
MMSSSTLLLILFTTLALSAGQVLFKLAAMDGESTRSLLQLLLSWKMITALSVYGIATLAWVYALRSVPLTLAYPFVALAYVIVPILAHFLLGEVISARTIAGAVFIIFGVWLSTT